MNSIWSSLVRIKKEVGSTHLYELSRYHLQIRLRYFWKLEELDAQQDCQSQS